MREPQVVRIPRVLITSLMATGTPARGGRGSPRAIRASIRSAWALARSGESVKNAFKRGLSRSMREKCSLANSRADIFLALSAARTLVIVHRSAEVELEPGIAILALDDLGHAEVGALGIRRTLQHLLANGAGHEHVLAKFGIHATPGAHSCDLSHRLDFRSVHGVQLRDVVEDGIKLRLILGYLGLGQFQMSQLGHAQHFFLADSHFPLRILGYQGKLRIAQQWWTALFGSAKGKTVRPSKRSFGNLQSAN